MHELWSTWVSARTRCWWARAPGTGCWRCCRSGPARAAIVTQDAIEVDVDPGVEQALFHLDDGEDAKSPRARSRSCAAAWTRWGLTRGDVVVAVGGGVVTDTGRLRGRRLPPGRRRRPRADHPARPGRRRHRRQDRRQPARGQEPGRRLLAAHRRAVRHRGPRSPSRLGSTAAGSGRWPSTPSWASTTCRTCALDEPWRPCVAIKAEVVAADEREGPSGRRALLNYGHTLAHALETVRALRPAPR